MLVLTLKIGDTVYIGQDIQVKCLETGRGGGKIKLGFVAPAHVQIDRKAVRERKEVEARGK